MLEWKEEGRGVKHESFMMKETEQMNGVIDINICTSTSIDVEVSNFEISRYKYRIMRGMIRITKCQKIPALILLHCFLLVNSSS